MWKMLVLFHLLLTLLLSHFSAAIPLEDFYPFGAETTDGRLEPTLDGSSSSIQLSSIFPFFGTNQTILFVSGCMTL